MVTIPERIAEQIEFLEQGEYPLNLKLERIIQHEYRRKLVRYQHADRLFGKKYQMDFETFRRTNMVAQLNDSFEVETDASDREFAIGDIRTMTRKIR
ncbi:hypothetical protein U27_01486 [Candidatus Vecturithrix granuli]|uniref:Uncharacterized protein n=1 Tax=Vecturithrix granuli TaxID=1499967 RepID=A0A081CAI0_VECG1|nr:hypothetical protein U27_01486 [Candidatus Vecturithrix granuli]